MARAATVTRALPEKAASNDIAFGDFGELLGYRLRRAQAAVHRDFAGSVAGLDLTQKQAAIIWLIHGNPGVSQVAVAGALDMDRPTMMALTDRLELRGLITRVRSTVDRRRQELHLTPDGRSLLAKLKKRIARHEQRIRELFTPAELASFVSALDKLQRLG
ncbi:MAG TPA: MarR family transcriptional regulator [Pseudomonadales bacterium]